MAELAWLLGVVERQLLRLGLVDRQLLWLVQEDRRLWRQVDRLLLRLLALELPTREEQPKPPPLWKGKVRHCASPLPRSGASVRSPHPASLCLPLWAGSPGPEPLETAEGR